MNQDEIIRMAREAGLAEWHESIQQHGFKFADVNNLERFFNLAFTAGAAHEREACAKVCEDYDSRTWMEHRFNMADEIAAAIRARSRARGENGTA